MKKLAKYIIVPILCLAANLGSAANIKDYPTVAVMDFGNKAITSKGLRGQDMSMATEYAIYQLSNSGWFDLIDYEQLNTIAKMHQINTSGMVDTSTAVQMGKITGAQFMVIGYVTGLTTKENIAGIRADGAKANNAQHVVNANVSVRIVDIETGRIVATGIGKGSSTSTMTEIGFTKYRNRENIVSKTVGSTVINDVKDELTTQNTKQNTNNSTTDSKSSNYNNENNYNRQDNINEQNKNSNSGSSNSRSGGSSSNSSYYIDKANQNGTSSSKYNNTGSSQEDYDYNQHLTDNTNRNSQSGSDYIGTHNQNGQSGNSGSSSANSDWKAGSTAIQTSGGPVEGIVQGKNQNQSWDVNIYNDNANSQVSSMGGESHADSSYQNNGYYDNNQIDRVSARTQSSENSSRDERNTVNSRDRKSDQRTITNNSSFNNNQSKSGSSGSTSAHSEYDNKNYQNQSQNSYDYDYNSNIKNSQSGKSSDNASHSNTYTNDYQDSVANKANNKTSVDTENKVITYEREAVNYGIVIGTVEVSDIQVRNAISKAVRDAIYGKTGLMTTLNNGKQLKIKTGF